MKNSNIDSVYRLTPMQEGILFNWLRDKNQYFEQFSCVLEGALNEEYFVESWTQLIKQNNVLRTAFVWEKVKKPMQVLLLNCETPFVKLDWSQQEESLSKEQFENYLVEDREKGFELDKAPLMRFALIKIAEEKFYFIWSFHHIIADGMSLPLMLAQVFETYQAKLQGRTSRLHKTMDFKDYSQWIWKQSREKAKDFWSDYLENSSLPVNFEDKNEKDGIGGENRYTVTLDLKLADKIEALAKQNGLSQFQIYNLAYAILLSKLSGKKDVTYGVTVSGRPLLLKGADSCVGIFINTVPMRVKVDESQTLLQYLEKMNQLQVERNPYEYLPLNEILECGNERMKLFQSIFIYENYGIDKYISENNLGFNVSDVKINEKINFPLAWMVHPGQEMSFDIVYDQKIISKAMVESMANAYTDILNGMVAHIKETVKEISLVNEPEKYTVCNVFGTDEKVAVYDSYGNYLPANFKGNIYKIGKEGKQSTNFVGQVNSAGKLVIDEIESKDVVIGTNILDLKKAQDAIKKETNASEVVLIASTEEKDKKVNIYYTSKEEWDEDKKKNVVALLKEVWNLTEDEVVSILTFVLVDEIPYCYDGTVSREKLAKILPQDVQKKNVEEGKEEKKTIFVPSTENEEILLNLWKQSLGKEEIYVDDTYTSAGGTSIGIMQMIARLRGEFNLDCTVDDFFDRGTIPQLAKVLTTFKKEETQAKDNCLSVQEKKDGVIASFAQKRHWFLYHLNKESSFYNTSETVKLSGKLDIEAFEKAIQSIVERHDILRTTFYDKKDEVYQRVAEKLDFHLNIRKIQDVMNSDNLNRDIDKYIYEEISQSFDLEKGPLFRCTVLDCQDNEYIFILVMHHIISDGWTMGIFLNELMSGYQAYHTNTKLNLPDVKWQYADYSLWQTKWFQGKVYEEELTYWKDKLEGVGELDFPLDFERAPYQTFSGQKKVFHFDKQISDKVVNLAKQTETSTFMIYMAALDVLLARYSNQTDIALGSPVAGRVREEVENTMGCFMNVLVYRNDVSGNPTFLELLERVKETALGAMKHQTMPFDILVDKLGIQRDMSKNPLYQIMFVLQNEMHPEEEMDDLEIERLISENKAAMLDLWISLREEENGIEFLIEYNTDLFMDDTIVRIAHHYERILDILCASPETNVENFVYLDQTEVDTIINKLNETEETFESNLYIHQLFEEQAMLHPEHEAIKFKDTSLTYQQLNERVNQLASYLINRGYGRNQMIGIYMDRSIEMMVAIYGILKAGAAYVPFDPGYPVDRIQYMIEASEVKLILTQEDKVAFLEDYSVEHVVLGNDDVTSKESKSNPVVEIQPDDYAYMIFTSGSTGKPKGVINSHMGIRNRILWYRREFPIAEHETQMQKTPFSFDVSCGEFFGALTMGARLVIAEPDGHRDVEYLMNLVEKEQVTHIHFVPSMLKPFVDNIDMNKVRSLRQVACTGEPLPYNLVERFKELFDTCQLINLYGPTEAAVEVSFWDCREEYNRKIIPIGRPISNTQFYVLDKNLQPVPFGVCGELYIAGDNLAVGYYKREKETQERFVENPYCKGSNKKMYRTGDVVRLLPGGIYDFIGRVDNQVKVRGHRIELGEIEYVIHTDPSVLDINVIATNELSPRIVAYLIRDLKEPNTKELQEKDYVTHLRELIKEKLPDYMVPSFFIMLDKMPLLPNGKLNRKALPVPSVSEQVDKNLEQPENDIEKKIMDIWIKVLNYSDFGINDNFFDVGGHSLLLIQMHNELKTAFDTDIRVIDMFKYPTIKSLATVISKVQSEKAQAEDEDNERQEKAQIERMKNRERMKKLRNLDD